jgi:two-component system nitrate/nitrite response regulator NarL
MRNGPRTSIVIIGHHILQRQGLAALLEGCAYRVIASACRASDLKDIPAMSDQRLFAILTIDNSAGSQAEAADNIRTLRSRFTCPIIVVVAETRNPVDIHEITALAPNAYITNLTSRELLLKILDFLPLAQPVVVLLSGATTASPPKALACSEQPDGARINGHSATSVPGNGRGTGTPLFSPREQQILRQLAQGNSNKEIARLFCITESTVKVHLKALLRKIGARNRTQAAIWAVAREQQVAFS